MGVGVISLQLLAWVQHYYDDEVVTFLNTVAPAFSIDFKVYGEPVKAHVLEDTQPMLSM